MKKSFFITLTILFAASSFIACGPKKTTDNDSDTTSPKATFSKVAELEDVAALKALIKHASATPDGETEQILIYSKTADSKITSLALAFKKGTTETYKIGTEKEAATTTFKYHKVHKSSASAKTGIAPAGTLAALPTSGWFKATGTKGTTDMLLFAHANTEGTKYDHVIAVEKAKVDPAPTAYTFEAIPATLYYATDVDKSKLDADGFSSDEMIMLSLVEQAEADFYKLNLDSVKPITGAETSAPTIFGTETPAAYTSTTAVTYEYTTTTAKVKIEVTPGGTNGAGEVSSIKVGSSNVAGTPSLGDDVKGSLKKIENLTIDTAAATLYLFEKEAGKYSVVFAKAGTKVYLPTTYAAEYTLEDIDGLIDKDGVLSQFTEETVKP